MSAVLDNLNMTQSYQDEMASLARQVSYLQVERDKLVTNNKSILSIAANDRQSILRQLHKLKEEAVLDKSLLQAKDRELQASLTQQFLLKEECKRLQHQMTKIKGHSSTNSSTSSLILYKSRKGQQQEVEEAMTLRHQMDSLRHELYKERMNRSREVLNYQSVIGEGKTKREHLENELSLLRSQLEIERASTVAIDHICNHAILELHGNGVENKPPPMLNTNSSNDITQQTYQSETVLSSSQRIWSPSPAKKQIDVTGQENALYEALRSCHLQVIHLRFLIEQNNSTKVDGELQKSSTSAKQQPLLKPFIDTIDLQLRESIAALSDNQLNQERMLHWETLNTQVLDYQKEIEMLKEILKNERSSRRSLEEQTGEYLSEMDLTSEHMAGLQSLLSSLRSENEELKQQVQSLAREGDEAQELVNSLRESLNELSAAEAKNDNVNSRQSKIAQSEMESLKQQLAILEKSLDIAQLENKSTFSDITGGAGAAAVDGDGDAALLIVSAIDSDKSKVDRINTNDYEKQLLLSEAKVQALLIQIQSMPSSLLVAQAEKRVSEAKLEKVISASDAKLRHIQLDWERQSSELFSLIDQLQSENKSLHDKVAFQSETIHQLTQQHQQRQIQVQTQAARMKLGPSIYMQDGIAGNSDMVVMQQLVDELKQLNETTQLHSHSMSNSLNLSTSHHVIHGLQQQLQTRSSSNNNKSDYSSSNNYNNNNSNNNNNNNNNNFISPIHKKISNRMVSQNQQQQQQQHNQMRKGAGYQRLDAEVPLPIVSTEVARVIESMQVVLKLPPTPWNELNHQVLFAQESTPQTTTGMTNSSARNKQREQIQAQQQQQQQQQSSLNNIVDQRSNNSVSHNIIVLPEKGASLSLSSSLVDGNRPKNVVSDKIESDIITSEMDVGTTTSSDINKTSAKINTPMIGNKASQHVLFKDLKNDFTGVDALQYAKAISYDDLFRR